MSDLARHSSFQAHHVTLKRGARVIWSDAMWSLQGFTALVGENGSGKSSTLAMLAGQVAPDEGRLQFEIHGQDIGDDDWMTHVTLAAPWVSLPSHLTLDEMLAFHGTFRAPREGNLGWNALLDASGLSVGKDVPLRLWSSGQRQRLNLALALGTQASAVLLDEPASNLDHDGIAWLQGVLGDVQTASTLVVATNDPEKEAPKAPSLLRIEKKLG